MRGRGASVLGVCGGRDPPRPGGTMGGTAKKEGEKVGLSVTLTLPCS